MTLTTRDGEGTLSRFIAATRRTALRRRRLDAAVAVAAAVMVSGCYQSTIGAHSTAGGQAGVVSAFEESRQGYAALDVQDHFRVCDAMVQVRDFTRFFDCEKALAPRLAPADALLPEPRWVNKIDAQDRNRPWTEYSMAFMRAEAYLYLGDHARALAEAERALALAENNTFRYSGVATAFNTLMSFGLGAVTNEAQAAATTRAGVASALGVVGVASARLGETARAKAAAARIATIDTSGFFGGVFDPTRKMWLARTLTAVDDHEGALAAMSAPAQASAMRDAFQAAIGVLGDFGSVDGRAITADDVLFALNFEPTFMLHQAQLKTGRLAEARQGYDAILAEPRVKGYGTVHFQALHGRALVALADGERAAAIDYLEDAVEVVEAQRSTIAGERYRISFVGDKQDVYRDMVGALLDAGDVDTAFAYAERAKARALVDLLASRTSFGAGARSTRVAALLETLDREEVHAAPTATDRTRGIAIAARHRIVETEPALAPLVTVSAPDTARIQALLAPGETLVEYFGGGEALFAFVLRPDGIRGFRLDGAGLDADVRGFRAAVDVPVGDGYAAIARRLYARLLKPLEAAIGTDTLLVVPHGILHYLPFAALNDGRRFVVETRAVRMAPSASVLTYLTRRAPAADGILVFGNPDLGDPRRDLPGAEAEARWIAGHHAGARLLVRGAATETAAKAEAGRYGAVHFATHGVFDAERPLTSGLLMAGDGGNDGTLTVGELYDLELDAGLVTLSACETALGQVANGDDVIGLTRGFLFAGARSVVASLWQVDDRATTTLMTRFYEHLARGENKRDALRAGQLAVLKAQPHPNYWAAFQVTGDL